MIVWLLHGCRLEVMRNLVQIISDANVPVAWSGASEFKKTTCSSWRRISEKSYSALHWITLHFSSPQLQTFPKHPPEQADYTDVWGWPGLCANSSNSHESVFTYHHTEDTIYVGAAFSFVPFIFFLTILYRRINTTTEWRSLWKCDIFSAVNFLMQVPVSSLHYTSPLYLILTKSAPLYYAKGFMNHTAIIKRFTQKMNTRRVTFSIDLRI